MRITAAVIIGFLIGVMIYGVANEGLGFVYTFIPLMLIIAVGRNSKKTEEDLKQVRGVIRDNKT